MMIFPLHCDASTTAAAVVACDPHRIWKLSFKHQVKVKIYIWGAIKKLQQKQNNSHKFKEYKKISENGKKNCQQEHQFNMTTTQTAQIDNRQMAEGIKKSLLCISIEGIFYLLSNCQYYRLLCGKTSKSWKK